MTRFRPVPTVLAISLASCFPALAQTSLDGGTQEIVVTAQKRQTLASKTPVALSVISGDDLKAEGAADTRRLADLVPNLSLGNAALGSVEVAIRGIGSNTATELGDPAVALNLDGVYLPRPQMAGATLYDIERVEVLRGPQGTLYGRNANAGAINIITRKPVRKFEGGASIGVSNYAGRQGDAMVNAALSDRFAVRAVISAAKRDGTIDTAHAPQNTFTKDRSDVDNVSARVHGLWNIAKDQSLLLSADYGLNRGAGPGAVEIDVVQANPTGSAGRYVGTVTAANPTGRGVRYEGHLRDEQTGISAEYKLATAVGELTVLGSHRQQDRELYYSVASANRGGYNFTKVGVDSIEARIASTDSGPLQYVAGVYFFREEDSPVVLGVGSNAPNLGVIGTLFYQDPTISKSQAIFGQLSYAVVPNLRLTTGLRTTRDDRSRTGCSYAASVLTNPALAPYLNANALPSDPPPASLLPACPAASINKGNSSYDKLTYRVGVDWEPSRNELLFASLATGFKAGGFNDGDATSTAGNGGLTYKPETITAFELGWKGRYGALQVAATAFHYDYRDLQVSSVVVCPSGANCNATQNAAKAKSQGLEVEGRWQITAVDRLNFAAALTDAHYVKFAAATSTANPAGVDWSGHNLDKAPKGTLSLGYSHQWTLGSGAGLTAFAGTRYSTAYTVSNPAAALHVSQGRFHKSDAHLTYVSADDRWDAQLYVRNIENRNVITSFQASGGANGVFLADPRTFGMQASLRF